MLSVSSVLLSSWFKPSTFVDYCVMVAVLTVVFNSGRLMEKDINEKRIN
jgi:hypothetical protein